MRKVSHQFDWIGSPRVPHVSDARQMAAVTQTHKMKENMQ